MVAAVIVSWNAEYSPVSGQMRLGFGWSSKSAESSLTYTIVHDPQYKSQSDIPSRAETRYLVSTESRQVRHLFQVIVRFRAESRTSADNIGRMTPLGVYAQTLALAHPADYVMI